MRFDPVVAEGGDEFAGAFSQFEFAGHHAGAVAIAGVNDDGASGAAKCQVFGGVQSVAGVVGLACGQVEVVVERNEARVREVDVRLGDHLLGAVPADDLRRGRDGLQDGAKSVDAVLIVLQDDEVRGMWRRFIRINRHRIPCGRHRRHWPLASTPAAQWSASRAASRTS